MTSCESASRMTSSVKVSVEYSSEHWTSIHVLVLMHARLLYRDIAPLQNGAVARQKEVEAFYWQT